MAKNTIIKAGRKTAKTTKKKSTSKTKTTKKETKPTKENPGPTLFDNKNSHPIPEKTGFHDTLFISVDNDMAHHFWAQMSFFCKDTKETPHFFEAFSDTFDNVILLSKKPMLLKTESESEIHYPVAFELDCDLLTDLECYSIVSQKVSKDKIRLATLLSQGFDYIAVNDLIPFTSVKKICFLSDENHNRFFSYPTKNIVFDRSLASVCPEQFEKTPDFDGTLKDTIANIDSWGQQTKQINHIRAALLACVNSFQTNISPNVFSSFDKQILNILFTGTLEEFDAEYKSLEREISRFLADVGCFPIIENDSTIPDSTIMQIKWVFNTVLNDRVNAPNYTEGLDSKDMQKTLNLYAYRVLSLALLTESEYTPIKFIDRYQDALSQNAKQFNDEDGINITQVNSILEKYFLALDKLKQIIKGLSFQKNQTSSNDYSTLKAFYDFTLAYSSEDHFESLSKRFELSDNTSTEHKRITWSLYGLLYGMYAINNTFRTDSGFILRLIDKRLGCFYNSKEFNNNTTTSKQVIKTERMATTIEYCENEADLDKMVDYLKVNDIDYLRKLRRDLAKRIIEVQNER